MRAGQPPWRGFTLVELTAVLVVLALLLTAGMPSMAAMMARQRLQATARHLQADVALARQQAVAQRQAVHVSLQAGAHWCWALSLDVAVDCRSARQGGAVIKVVRADDHPHVALDEAAAMALDGRNGTRLSATGQALFSAGQGVQLAVRLNTLGRAHVCTPAGAMAGVPACGSGG